MGGYYTKGFQSDLIIPGVHLPPTEILSNYQRIQLLFDNSLKSNDDQISWLAKSTRTINKIEGVPKNLPNALKDIQDLFIQYIIPNKQMLPADYKYFGSNSNKQNLPLFLASNPFFASALRNSKNGNFEVISKNTNKDDEETFFSRLVGTLDESYLRVNAEFDENMKLISITAVNGKLDKSEEQLCDALMFLLFFYSEVFHAIVHVFHLLMVTGIADSTEHSKIQATWASQYFDDVFVKYEEVKIILFSVKGMLTGGTFRSDRDQVMVIVREIFCLWGNFKTAEQFIDRFLLRSLKINRKGILTEFIKHANLVGPYAKELVTEFAKINGGKEMEETNKLLTLFYKNVGEGVSSITELTTWIELMTITGIIHGSTLSFSRLGLNQPMLALVTDKDTFSSVESSYVLLCIFTMVGILEDRSCFAGSQSMPPNIRHVILKYYAESLELKDNYFNQIKKEPDFLENGWVYTDYCLDGVDGKQFTITTYI